MNLNFRTAALGILIFGTILRLTLAVVNREANDDHLSVIKIMALENRIPDKHELPAAYHPKLYHGTAAALVRLVPRQMLQLQENLAEMVSCIAGILALFFAYRFTFKEIEATDKVRLIAFSLLALNPALIGINAQATNDSFVILFGNLAFYFGWRFFQNLRLTDFAWMLVVSILGALSKVNAFVIFIAIVATFALAVCRIDNMNYPPRRVMAVYGMIFLAIYLALVPTLGPYWEHYRLYGSPLPGHAQIAPESLPFTLPADSKPGDMSIVGSLFTFPLMHMVRHPVLATDNRGVPETPNSIWEELYGRTHFVHFDAWPRSWQLGHRRFQWVVTLVYGIGSLIFLLALVPTVLMISGLLRSLFAAGRVFVSGRLSGLPLPDWLLLISSIGYVLLVIGMRVRFKEFGAVKSIYIFPGFFGFVLFFARECDRFYLWCANKKVLSRFADLIFVLLFALYASDATILVGQLGYNIASELLQ